MTTVRTDSLDRESTEAANHNIHHARGILARFLHTDHDVSAFVLRLALGIAIFPHGAQKMLGAFGGPGFAGTMAFFTQTLGIPSVFAFLVIFTEFFGAIALLVGLLGRVAAFGVACVMVVAALMVHLQHGFFMNWFGNQQGEGFEYHILAAGIAVALMIKGSGAFSIDRLVCSRARPNAPRA